MVGPADRIPAYRLSGDAVAARASAASPPHWRDALGPALEEAVGDRLLVDLRSSMYAAFWRPPATLARRVATVRVLHEVAGKRQVVSHFNKATKGRIVRELLEVGREPAHPRAAGRGAARPGLDRRGRRRRPRRAPGSTWWSASSDPLGAPPYGATMRARLVVAVVDGTAPVRLHGRFAGRRRVLGAVAGVVVDEPELDTGRSRADPQRTRAAGAAG